MLDLSAEEKDPAAAAPARPGKGQRVWAVLLVLDSFFVIIFGGAVAAKIYQHWQAPAAAPLASRTPPPPLRRPAASPAAATKLAAAPATISVPRPRPRPAAKAAAPKGPTPNPALIDEEPRHAQAVPQGAGSQAPAPLGKVRAQPVEFVYKGRGRRVSLAGAFIVHGNGRKAMSHHDGIWSITVYLTPNTYRYWFVVDGRKKLDPANAQTRRDASLITVSPKQ